MTFERAIQAQALHSNVCPRTSDATQWFQEAPGSDP
jgi:hypothetical protein